MILRPTIRALRWVIAPAILLALWLPGINQGGFRVDTGLYAAVSLHAYRDGSLFPLMAGELPYFNKPPLAFWIHGLFLHALGPELWAARLPSLIAAMFGAVFTTMIGSRLAGPRVGLLAGVILALTLEWFRYTRAISLDLWVAVFLLGAIWSAARALTCERASRGTALSWGAIAGVFIGLSLMTKPMTGLLAVPLLVGWMLWAGTATRRALLFGAVACAVSLLVATPWHVAMHLRFPDTFASHYFGKQSLDRAAGEGFDAKPAWFYALLLAQTHWPWLAAVVAACIAMLRGQRMGTDPRRAALRLSLLWTAAWMLALSLFAAKMGRYAVTLYPMLALLAAFWLMHRAPRPIALVRRAFIRYAAPVMLVVCIALAALNVRVHAPASAHWGALGAYLAEHDPSGDTLWTHPDMLWSAANVYLSRGSWPRFITPETRPPAGALVLYSDTRDGAAHAAPGPNEREVWRSSRLYVTRVGD